MEGQLNQDDSILKVAVKTMKSESSLCDTCAYMHICICIHTHHLGPHSLNPHSFPMPLRRQKCRRVNGKLALA